MRKDNFFDTRARELCVAAGIDPDSRVGEGRGMPAWCTFRDAARQEKLAREASELELPPQAPQFQNAPLKVFGERELDAGPDAQLHGRRQRGCRHHLRRRASGLCAAGRRGDRL